MSTRSIRLSYAAFTRAVHSTRSHGSHTTIRPTPGAPYASLLQLEGDVLRPGARVREDKGGPMFLDHVAQQHVHPRVRRFHVDLGQVADRTQDREIEGLAGLDLHDVHLAGLPAS